VAVEISFSGDPISAKLESVTLAGTDLCYRQFGGGQRPLLLLHTFWTQMDYAQRIAPLLVDRYRIYTIDLPGHGQSSKNPAIQHDAKFFVSAAAKFIEHQELTDLTLMGESIGGTISLLLAAETPQRISRVVACNPYDYPGPMIGGLVGRLVSYLGRYTTLGTRLAIAPLLRLFFAAGCYDSSKLPPDYMTLLADLRRADPKFAACIKSVLRNYRSWTVAADAAYPKIPDTVSIDVIYGQRDWGPAAAPEVNRQRLGERARITTLPKVGHFSFLEDPEGVVEILLREPGSSA